MLESSSHGTNTVQYEDRKLETQEKNTTQSQHHLNLEMTLSKNTLSCFYTLYSFLTAVKKNTLQIIINTY